MLPRQIVPQSSESIGAATEKALSPTVMQLVQAISTGEERNRIGIIKDKAHVAYLPASTQIPLVFLRFNSDLGRMELNPVSLEDLSPDLFINGFPLPKVTPGDKSRSLEWPNIELALANGSFVVSYERDVIAEHFVFFPIDGVIFKMTYADFAGRFVPILRNIIQGLVAKGDFDVNRVLELWSLTSQVHQLYIQSIQSRNKRQTESTHLVALEAEKDLLAMHRKAKLSKGMGALILNIMKTEQILPINAADLKDLRYIYLDSAGIVLNKLPIARRFIVTSSLKAIATNTFPEFDPAKDIVILVNATQGSEFIPAVFGTLILNPEGTLVSRNMLDVSDGYLTAGSPIKNTDGSETTTITLNEGKHAKLELVINLTVDAEGVRISLAETES